MMTLLGIPPRNDSELPELIRNNDDADMCGIKEIIEKNNYHKLPTQQTLAIPITMQVHKR